MNTLVKDVYYPQRGDTRADVLHYDLRLGWAPSTRTLRGTATIYFRMPARAQHVYFDLAKPLRVREMRLDGRAVSFRRVRGRLDIDAGAMQAKESRHTLVVRYDGTPRSVPAPTRRWDFSRIGWHTTKRGEVWTMQEPFGAFTWYPVNDHPSDKAYYDVRISAPKSMVGIFNGRLVSRRTSSSRTVTQWHLASPTSSYLTTIAIGDYVRHRDTGPHGLPITYWLPRRDQSALSELRRTPSMIRWLERRLGPFPFDRIGALVVPNQSAMETQTLVTMGSRLLADQGRLTFRADLLHEYAHQWYGDAIGPNNWRDLWLNESFAMYTQLRWEISQGWHSRAEVIDDLDSEDASLRAEQGPPGAYDKKQFASLCVYLCGARMLFRLQRTVGDDIFATLWRRWPQQHRFGTSDEVHYSQWADRVSGTKVSALVGKFLYSKTSPP